MISHGHLLICPMFDERRYPAIDFFCLLARVCGFSHLVRSNPLRPDGQGVQSLNLLHMDISK